MPDVFLLGEKYRLDFKWSKVTYKDNICIFDYAEFSGPVLSFAEKIIPNSSMQLDFFKQYFVLVENVYIGKLSWGEVIYNNNGTVSLADCVLTHKSEINNVPKLKDNDTLVVDCKLHERETHDFYPNYPTYVANSDIQIYDFIEG